MKRLILYSAFVVVAFLMSINFTGCEEKLGDYLYFDPQLNVVHADRNCENLNSTPRRVKINEFFYDYKYDLETSEENDLRYCNTCIDDDLYTEIKRKDVEREVELDTANIRDVYYLLEANDYELTDIDDFINRMNNRVCRIAIYREIKRNGLDSYRNVAAFEDYILKQ